MLTANSSMISTLPSSKETRSTPKILRNFKTNIRARCLICNSKCRPRNASTLTCSVRETLSTPKILMIGIPLNTKWLQAPSLITSLSSLIWKQNTLNKYHKFNLLIEPTSSNSSSSTTNWLTTCKQLIKQLWVSWNQSTRHLSTQWQPKTLKTYKE